MVFIYVISACLVIALLFLLYCIGKVRGMETAKEITNSGNDLLRCADNTLKLCESMSQTNGRCIRLLEEQYAFWKDTCKELGLDYREVESFRTFHSDEELTPSMEITLEAEKCPEE